jgi:hypothetical protein
MVLFIDYDKNKVLQALRYHFISRLEIKVLLILVNVFAIVAATLFAFKIVQPLPFLVSSLLWFVLMITFWYWLPHTIYKKSSTFHEPIKVEFKSTEIHLETEKGRAVWLYNKFQYYVETPNFFHLYISDKSFFLIPKDSLEQSDYSFELRKLLDDKVGSKK